MGGLLRPVGPQPPSVYWTRRVLVLAAALVVIVTGWLLWPGSGGDGARAVADTGATPRPTTTAGTPAAGGTPAATSTAKPTATPTGKATGSTGGSTSKATPTASPVRTCRDADISVTTRTDARSYPAGVRPRLTLVITNTSSTTCRRDVGPTPLTLLVSSGSQRMWSSDDCAPSSGSLMRTLQPGKSYTTTVTWARLTSAPGCPTSARHAADPGTYVVSGAAGGVTGGNAVFTLG